MNCSGKHAAMLATCVGQRVGPRDRTASRSTRCSGRSRQTFAELTGEPIAVDRRRRLRCAAVLDVADRSGPGVLARWWSPIRVPRSVAIVDAFVAHPAYASGTTRDEAALHAAIPGAIGKAGAEACYAVALPDGRAVALKIDDGYPRARPVVMAAALRRSGLDGIAGVDLSGGRRDGSVAAARRRTSRSGELRADVLSARLRPGRVAGFAEPWTCDDTCCLLAFASNCKQDGDMAKLKVTKPLTEGATALRPRSRRRSARPPRPAPRA